MPEQKQPQAVAAQDAQTTQQPTNRYEAIIARVFANNHKGGDSDFTFTREEFVQVAADLGIALPKNLGDVIYSFRYRKSLPASITATAPDGLEWIIVGAGRAVYRFRLAKPSRIEPREELVTIKIPDATPEIIGAYALNDEQALLAKIRYNRLIDVFLGVTAFSLQNHLRTTVKGVGQIEIDEIYVAVDRHGRQYVVPVQAKGVSDRHGAVQTEQDRAYCGSQPKLKPLICRLVSAQFMTNNRIAMFELTVEDGDVKVIDEKHYKLVPASSITAADLAGYGVHGGQ